MRIKALELTGRHLVGLQSSPAAGRPVRGSIRRAAAGCGILFHGGAQLSARSVSQSRGKTSPV